MKLGEIIFVIIGVGISQFLPALHLQDSFSNKINSRPLWQFWIIITVVVSSILIFFLHPIFKELSDVFTFVQSIVMGFLFPIGYGTIYYTLEFIIKPTLEKTIGLLIIISYTISVILLVIITVYIFEEKRLLSYDINDYNIDTIDSTVYIPQSRLASYAENYMNSFPKKDGYFTFLFQLKIIMEHTDSTNNEYKNIYDSLQYKLNILITDYESINNMLKEKDSVAGRLIYAKLKQGKKRRYAVLLEYKDSKKILSINKTKYELDSDYIIGRHPIFMDFRRKYYSCYDYFYSKSYLVDEKFKEVLDTNTIKFSDDFDIKWR